jgi:hypothetical protein
MQKKRSIALPTSFYPVNNIVSFQRNIPGAIASLKPKNNSFNGDNMQQMIQNQDIENIKNNHEVLSLKEREKIINSLKDLLMEYKQTIKPLPRFTVDFNNFLGYQIIDKRNNLPLPSQSNQIPLASRFAQVITRSKLK